MGGSAETTSLVLLDERRESGASTQPTESEICPGHSSVAEIARRGRKYSRASHCEAPPMKVQRTLAPSAAPINWRDLVHGLAGLLRPQATRRRLEAEFREYFGVKHVWFVSSGKAAFSLILLALHSLSGRQKVVVPG